MGAKYPSKSISGYNSIPPADDGSATEANRTTWAKHKTKLADPIKDLSEAINTALVTQVNEEVLDKGAAFTTTVAEHKKTINVTGAFTQSLGDATTMGTSYIVTIKNSHTAAITVDLDTAGDTLDGSAAGSTTLAPKQAKVFITNTAANGYYVLDADVFDAISITGATDSTSGSTGSINTAGGIGAVKDIVTDANFSDADGEVHPLFLQSVTATTSGTTHDYTSIPAWVKRITMMFNRVSTSGSLPLEIIIGDAGGFETSGYEGRNSSGTTESFSAASYELTHVTTASYSGIVVLILMDGSNNTWAESGNLSGYNVAGSLPIHVSAGIKSLSAALTQIRLTAGGDTFNAGEINVLYE